MQKLLPPNFDKAELLFRFYYLAAQFKCCMEIIKQNIFQCELKGEQAIKSKSPSLIQEVCKKVVTPLLKYQPQLPTHNCHMEMRKLITC